MTVPIINFHERVNYKDYGHLIATSTYASTAEFTDMLHPQQSSTSDSVSADSTTDSSSSAGNLVKEFLIIQHGNQGGSYLRFFWYTTDAEQKLMQKIQSETKVMKSVGPAATATSASASGEAKVEEVELKDVVDGEVYLFKGVPFRAAKLDHRNQLNQVGIQDYLTEEGWTTPANDPSARPTRSRLATAAMRVSTTRLISFHETVNSKDYGHLINTSTHTDDSKFTIMLQPQQTSESADSTADSYAVNPVKEFLLIQHANQAGAYLRFFWYTTDSEHKLMQYIQRETKVVKAVGPASASTSDSAPGEAKVEKVELKDVVDGEVYLFQGVRFRAAKLDDYMYRLDRVGLNAKAGDNEDIDLDIVGVRTLILLDLASSHRCTFCAYDELTGLPLEDDDEEELSLSDPPRENETSITTILSNLYTLQDQLHQLEKDLLERRLRISTFGSAT
ncbi:hypothetical protein HK102_006651 [Quaeritorhiza haematococci]|nr:hypothetical protein HK102_006651 [Quaeritorhiza haematococci]